MSEIRFEHKTLLDGRYHVITSPDIQGFHATGETEAEAFSEALALIQAFSRQKLIPPLGSIAAIQFDPA